MIGKSTQTRLCPYCANSIAADAAKCNYCKAELESQPVPQWLNRDESSPEVRAGVYRNKKSAIPSKFIWPAAMLVVALAAFFVGGYISRSQLLLLSQANLRQVQAKDQIIQTQETQLAQTRQQLNDSATQLADLKTKLEESRKELSASHQRLAAATRETERLNANRSVAIRRTPSRATDAAASVPASVTARRSAEPGVYETTQETSVYENPSSTARVISQVARGTRLNVVSSTGNWLEVRSKHGNPPGYVRSDDARLIARAN